MLGLRRILAAACLALIALGVVAGTASSDDPPRNGLEAVPERSDRYVPRAPGTVSKYKFYFGPYTVPPGHDANRVDLEVPLQDGMIISVEPGMKRVHNLTEPSHQEAHIHHAHWFALDPGNEEDNYTYGNTEWIFGNGDEETKADFQERSDADPKGPVYGQAVGLGGPQLMIYMLHNKTSEPLPVYIVLDVTFKHGTAQELKAATGRAHHDVTGVLFGRTYDVPRQPTGDGIYETTKDSRPIEWTSTVDGTMIGTGGHLHPGGIRVEVENLGSKENPCPRTGRGYEGTHLLTSEALFRNAPFSEDFQMSVTHPAWRAPIHKGDRIRITGVYENKDHGWYDVMTHEGIYIDEQQRPRGRCRPYLVGDPKEEVTTRRVTTRHMVRKRVVRRVNGRRVVRVVRRPHVIRVRHVHRKRNGKRVVHIHRRVHRHTRTVRTTEPIDPTEGVMNRPWDKHVDVFCGERFGAQPCDRPEPDRGPGHETNLVNIANFVYHPGDRSLSGKDGAPPRIKKGTSMTFFNADQQAGIRHSVTTCEWPCNGRYVANHPFPDGIWDSETLGYDPVDGGEPNPVASTPSNLEVGKYSYFCRIHPWMRGAFEVVP